MVYSVQAISTDVHFPPTLFLTAFRRYSSPSEFIVAIRGSTENPDELYEFVFNFGDMTAFPRVYNQSNLLGCISDGASKAFIKLLRTQSSCTLPLCTAWAGKTLEQYMLPLWTSVGNAQIKCFGHSFGGTLAHVFGIYFQQWAIAARSGAVVSWIGSYAGLTPGDYNFSTNAYDVLPLRALSTEAFYNTADAVGYWLYNPALAIWENLWPSCGVTKDCGVWNAIVRLLGCTKPASCNGGVTTYREFPTTATMTFPCFLDDDSTTCLTLATNEHSHANYCKQLGLPESTFCDAIHDSCTTSPPMPAPGDMIA